MFNPQSTTQRAAESEPPTEGFAQIVTRLASEPGIQQGTGFSADPGLRADGKLFAMLRDSELVLRLAATHADQLVRSRRAARFYPLGHARLAQWVAVPASQAEIWLQTTEDALAYARGAG